MDDGQGGSRQKRSRVNFTMKQLEAMETVFMQSQYPDVTVLETLAAKMELPVEKICTWFQNRRSRFRKDSKTGHIHWMRQQLYTATEFLFINLESQLRLVAEVTGNSLLINKNSVYTAPNQQPGMRTVPSANTSCHVLTTPSSQDPQKMPTASLHYLPPHCQPQTTCYNRPAPGYAPPPGPSPIYQHQQTTLQPLRHEANISQQDFMASPHGLATSQLSVQRAHAASSVSPYGYGEMNYSSAPLGGVFNHNSSAYNSYPQQFHTFDM